MRKIIFISLAVLLTLMLAGCNKRQPLPTEVKPTEEQIVVQDTKEQSTANTAAEPANDVARHPDSWTLPGITMQRLDIKAQFIMCMISDGDGGAYIGTEDDGIFHYDKQGNIKQYTDIDGLGDPNVYAMAVDKKQRLWVGHLSTGVSVFNGEKWKNYDVLDGPIGSTAMDGTLVSCVHRGAGDSVFIRGISPMK